MEDIFNTPPLSERHRYKSSNSSSGHTQRSKKQVLSTRIWQALVVKEGSKDPDIDINLARDAGELQYLSLSVLFRQL